MVAPARRARCCSPLLGLVLALSGACASHDASDDGFTVTTQGSGQGSGGTATDEGDEPPTTSASGSAGPSDSGGDACEPLHQADGSVSGCEICPSDGVIVRVSSEACFDPLPPSSGTNCASGYGTCTSDADCLAEPFGVCRLMNDSPACGCEYGCRTDEECGSDQACLCAPIDQGTRCVEAECRTADDCPAGERCVLEPSQDWQDAVLICAPG